MDTQTTDIRPPKPPWLPLEVNPDAGGVLSFHYSDQSATIPVREVTRADDNKADPNLETMTYGLFTTCQRGMRAGLVNRGVDHIFFCTRRSGIRVLTGFYRIGWFCKGPPIQGYARGGRIPVDYALAAAEARFVNPGFPLRELTDYLCGVRLDTRFRTFRYIDRETTRLLRRLLKRTRDSTNEYLAEIKRLEQVNMDRFGFYYYNWRRTEGFSWDVAPHYLEVKE